MPRGCSLGEAALLVLAWLFFRWQLYCRSWHAMNSRGLPNTCQSAPVHLGRLGTICAAMHAANHQWQWLLVVSTSCGPPGFPVLACIAWGGDALLRATAYSLLRRETILGDVVWQESTGSACNFRAMFAAWKAAGGGSACWHSCLHGCILAAAPVLHTTKLYPLCSPYLGCLGERPDIVCIRRDGPKPCPHM